MIENCKHCGYEMEYDLSPNFILFCPECKRFVYLSCEKGYGPVVPCRILLGKKEIACVQYEDRRTSTYRYDSDVFHVHKVLEHGYFDALIEARDLTASFLKDKGK